MGDDGYRIDHNQSGFSAGYYISVLVGNHTAVVTSVAGGIGGYTQSIRIVSLERGLAPGLAGWHTYLPLVSQPLALCLYLEVGIAIGDDLVLRLGHDLQGTLHSQRHDVSLHFVAVFVADDAVDLTTIAGTVHFDRIAVLGERTGIAEVSRSGILIVPLVGQTITGSLYCHLRSFAVFHGYTPGLGHNGHRIYHGQRRFAAVHHVAVPVGDHTTVVASVVVVIDRHAQGVGVVTLEGGAAPGLAVGGTHLPLVSQSVSLCLDRKVYVTVGGLLILGLDIDIHWSRAVTVHNYTIRDVRKKSVGWH